MHSLSLFATVSDFGCCDCDIFAVAQQGVWHKPGQQGINFLSKDETMDQTPVPVQ